MDDGSWYRQESKYTFETCWDTTRRCIRYARGQLRDFQAHGATVPYKLNQMPEYAQRMIAWSMLARKETEYNHASEFIRYACAHHFKLVDARDGPNAECGDDTGSSRHGGHSLSRKENYIGSLLILALNAYYREDDAHTTNVIDSYTPWVLSPPRDDKESEAQVEARKLLEGSVARAMSIPVDPCGLSDEDRDKREAVRRGDLARFSETTRDFPDDRPYLVLRMLLQRDVDEHAASNEQLTLASVHIRDMVANYIGAICKVVSDLGRVQDVFKRPCVSDFQTVFGYNHIGRSELTEHHNMTISMVKQAARFCGSFLPFSLYDQLVKEEGETNGTITVSIKTRALVVAFRNPRTMRMFCSSKFLCAVGSGSAEFLDLNNYGLYVGKIKELCVGILGVDTLDGGTIKDPKLRQLLSTKVSAIDDDQVLRDDGADYTFADLRTLRNDMSILARP